MIDDMNLTPPRSQSSHKYSGKYEGIVDAQRWDELKDLVKTVPILDVVSTRLDNVGTKNKPEFLCPFHDDKTPGSFQLDILKNQFKCFSCNKQGTTIDFVMDFESKTIQQAVFELAVQFPTISKISDEEIKAYETKTKEKLDIDSIIANPVLVEKKKDYRELKNVEVSNFFFNKIAEFAGLDDRDFAYLKGRNLSDKDIRETGYFTLTNGKMSVIENDIKEDYFLYLDTKTGKTYAKRAYDDYKNVKNPDKNYYLVDGEKINKSIKDRDFSSKQPIKSTITKINQGLSSKEFFDELVLKFDIPKKQDGSYDFSIIQVPGVSVNLDSTKNYIFKVRPSLATEGIGIPTKDSDGRIQAIQFRRRGTSKGFDGARYKWLTSAPGPNTPDTIIGISPGTPVGVYLPKDLSKFDRSLLISEGHFKADQLAKAANAISLSVPGVQNFKNLDEEINKLALNKDLRFNKIRIFYDMDIYKNENVFKALVNLNDYLNSEAMSSYVSNLLNRNFDSTNNKTFDSSSVNKKEILIELWDSSPDWDVDDAGNKIIEGCKGADDYLSAVSRMRQKNKNSKIDTKFKTMRIEDFINIYKNTYLPKKTGNDDSDRLLFNNLFLNGAYKYQEDSDILNASYNSNKDLIDSILS